MDGQRFFSLPSKDSYLKARLSFVPLTTSTEGIHIGQRARGTEVSHTRAQQHPRRVKVPSLASTQRERVQKTSAEKKAKNFSSTAPKNDARARGRHFAGVSGACGHLAASSPVPQRRRHLQPSSERRLDDVEG
jgi:hypothetical protein